MSVIRIVVSYEHTPVSIEDASEVVIGGTSGIGQAIALGFAREGVDVIATGRSEECVDETTAAIEARGARTVRITCDVTGGESLRAVRDTVEDEFGSLDIVVAPQGAISRESATDTDDSEWTASWTSRSTASAASHRR